MSHPDTSEATVMTDVMSRVRPQAPFRAGFLLGRGPHAGGDHFVRHVLMVKSNEKRTG